MDKDKVKELCINGLITDGGHHKQWYLEQILVAIGYNVADVKSDVQMEGYDWEDGIAP